MKKPLRQQNRQIISYVPRTEPAPPEHAIKMDSFRDVWMLRGKYVAFVLMGESFLRSPAFTVPESAQRWADSGTVNAGERRNDSPISTNATYLPRSIQTSRNESIFIACSGGAGSVRGT